MGQEDRRKQKGVSPVSARQSGEMIKMKFRRGLGKRKEDVGKGEDAASGDD